MAELRSPGNPYERLLWREQTPKIQKSVAIYDPKETFAVLWQ